MSLLEAIYFAAIVLVGVPSALRLNGRVRNATALAMVATWTVCRLLYEAVGPLSIDDQIKVMILSDAAVIGAMFVKEDWRVCSYRGTAHQLACLWHERTPWDQRILALFPLVWIFYFPVVDGQKQYWALWGLGLAQLMLAGLEALHMHFGRMAIMSRADTPEQPPPRSDFTTAWGSGAYG